MGLVGTGDGEWIEFDADGSVVDRLVDLIDALHDNRDVVERLLGPDFSIEVVGAELVVLLVDGVPRYRAGLNRDGRLILTVVFDPEGPL